MTNDENVKTADEQIAKEKSEEENDGGRLKIKTNVKAGSDPPILVGGGG
jgi:hypothetical protein